MYQMPPGPEPEPEETEAVEIISDEEPYQRHTWSYRAPPSKGNDNEDNQHSWNKCSSYYYEQTQESWESEDTWGKWRGDSSSSSRWK